MTTDNKPNPNEVQRQNSRPIETLDHAGRKRDKHYDGATPLEWPDLETVAEFLVTPKQIRELKTFTDLAKHLKVSRMTVYRWTKDEDVLIRTGYLAIQNQLMGDLVARINWDRIMMGQVKAAIKGDTRAAKFCEKRAWPGIGIF